MEPARSLQLQIDLPYKKEAREDRRVAACLAQGYRIRDLFRVSDGEMLVTLERPAVPETTP